MSDLLHALTPILGGLAGLGVGYLIGKHIKGNPPAAKSAWEKAEADAKKARDERK